MADIKFTSKLDGSGFKRGMAGIASTAQSGAQRAGREFTKSFNQQINRYLGVGFAIAMFSRLGTTLKDMRQLRIDAILKGVTPERLQAIQKLSKYLGDAFSQQTIDKQLEMADAFIANGNAMIYTAEQTEVMARASEKLEGVLNDVKYAALLVAESLSNAFEAGQSWIERAVLWNRLLIENKGDVAKSLEQFSQQDNIQRAQGESMGSASFIEDTARQLAGSTSPSAATRPARTPTTISPVARQSDSLQRIGLFVGGAGNPVIAIQREQIQVLQALLKSSVRLERQIDKKI